MSKRRPMDDPPQELIAELQAVAPHLATKLTFERLAFVRRLAEGTKRIAALEAALQQVIDLGHNDECLFCGFKDKQATIALESTDG